MSLLEGRYKTVITMKHVRNTALGASSYVDEGKIRKEVVMNEQIRNDCAREADSVRIRHEDSIVLRIDRIALRSQPRAIRFLGLERRS